ncbi:DUF2510 domain-containing protein [Nocardioides antri]|uniref:DUF2510 domain-containing protein n=1 Tax=Nocardioides antri TaxID=2607659 RepID=A0A5B1M4R0_9ACTN|nr:DUF2510 domain-containing protein [Nocardioides antri]KAA1427656.1 DUF2510 domain-containing protein [Nocardioides antri]
MSDPNQPSTPPGWYPDGQGGQRWWDGNQWTEHTQPPQGGAPAAPAAPAAPSSPPSGTPGADLPTQVAPNRASGYPQSGQSGQSGQPQQPQQGGYGAPAGGYGQPTGQQQYGGFPSGGSGSSGGGKGKLIAIIGGAIGALLLVVILLVVLFSVIGGGSPEDVANDYLEASVDGDFGRACELVTKDDQEQAFEDLDIDECGDVEDAVKDSPEYDEEEFEEYLDDFETEYEIGDVKEEDDTAEVEFTSTTEYTGDDESVEDYFEGGEQDGTIYLVKEDGDWKVDAEKSDSVGIF